MPVEKYIHTLRELCHVESSKNLAVIYHDGKTKEMLTYANFLELQTELTVQLEKIVPLGEGKCVTVGIYSEPSVYVPVIVHALINLSVVFVPLMLDSSSTSLVNFIKMCALKYIIVEDRILSRFLSQMKEQLLSCRVHNIAGVNSMLVIVEVEVDLNHIKPQNISYIVQSSGSTGKPKVIFVPENCIIPNVTDLRCMFSVSSEDVLFIPSALTFDASIVQMFLTWFTGAAMVLISTKLHNNPNMLASTLANVNVSVLQCTPSFIHLMGNESFERSLLHKESKLRVLALGGERFPQKETVKRWLSTKTFQLFNIYGTSEVSSWASIHKVSEADICHDNKLDGSDWVPIGLPLYKTNIEIRKKECDEERKESFGEIWIGGEERKCFVYSDENTCDFHEMRFSGDVGKIKDGRIYFCGRNDNKIKHNGQLIDLDVLCMVVERKCDLCCCLFQYSPLNNQEELFLFIKPLTHTKSTIYIEAEILNIIKKDLSPAYIPENIIFVENFAVTPHGKINKCMLKNHPSLLHSQLSTYSIKDLLSYTWNASLGLDVDAKINSDDNFATCGGDSFTAIYFLNNIVKYVNNREPGLLTDTGGLFECIQKNTFNKLTIYVDNIINKVNICEKMNKNVEIDTSVLHGNDKVVPPIKRKCCHFISYQKQGVISNCYCIEDVSPMHFSTVNNEQHLVLTESWRYNLGKCIDASPSVVFNDEFKDGIVYIGSHSHVIVGVTLNRGECVWKATLGDRIESSVTMCYGGGFIAVGCYDGYIYFLKANTGDVHWRFYTGDAVKSSPISDNSNDILIVGSHGKKIHALNVSLKKCLWVFNCDGSCFSTPLINPQLNCVYIALLSGQIISLDVKTGSILWENSLGKPIFSSPCLCESIIVVGCVDCCLYAIDFSGDIVWKFGTGGPVFSSPVYLKLEFPNKELIIFGSNDHCIHCLNIEGKLIWKYKTTSRIVASVGVIRYKPCSKVDIYSHISDTKHKLEMKKVCESKEKTLHVNQVSEDERKTNTKIEMNNVSNCSLKTKRKFDINQDGGEKRKKFNCAGKVCTHPSGMFIVTASTNGTLYVLNAQQGSLACSYTFPGGIYSSPVVVNDAIVVGCRDDNVYSLKLMVSSVKN